jgi:hypothetical protein
MSANEEDLVIRRHREEVERRRREGVPSLRPAEPPTIPYPELPEAEPDSPLSREWNFYRREVGRLLAEGLEGRWVLIQGETLFGIWDTQADADAVRLERFLMQPVLLKQVLAREPILRIGYNRLCRS